MQQTWSALRNFGNSGQAGAAYASSTTLTDVNYLTTTNCVLAASELQVGSQIELMAYGQASNTGTPTLLLGFYYGGVAGVALAATAAITTTTAMTAWTWFLYWTGVVRTVGTAGTILGAGTVEIPTSLTAFTARRIPEVALATVAIDTTTAKALTVGAQWGTSNASNTLTCHGFSVRSIA
jgi:hypothetical protein